MPLVLFLVYGSTRLEFAGELHGGGHGATAPALAFGRPSATASAQERSRPSLDDQRPSIEHTGSAVKIAKESLNFFTLESAVLGSFLRLRFLHLKAYLGLAKSVYAFIYLQVYHWNCFAHEMLILIPN